MTAFNNKLYRSTDGGETFEVVSESFFSDFSAPRVIGRSGDFLVLGCIEGDRVYQSADDGVTWTPVYEGLPEIMGFPGAVPSDLDFTDDLVVMGGTNFILKSTDNGASWEPLAGVLGSTVFGIDKVEDDWYVCVSANEPNLPAYPIYRSTDDGLTWDALPAAPETDLGIGNPIAQNSNAITVLGGTIFAITGSNAGDALQKSEDDGESWQQVGDFIFGSCIRNYNGDLYLTTYDGFYRSQNGGETWDLLLGPEYFGLSENGYLFRDGNKIWIATSQGPLYFNLNTETFSSPAIPSASIPNLIASNGILVGVQNGQVSFSNDYGNSYEEINGIFSDNFFATSASIDGNTIFISGTSGFSGDFIVYSSDDSGNSWSLFDGLPQGSGTGAILSYNPLVYGVGLGADLTFYRSDNDGESWNEAEVTVIGGPLIPDAVIQKIERHGNILFADITNGFGYSLDNGQNWTLRAMDTDSPVYGWEDRFVRMYVHPIFQTKSLELSADLGETWEPFIEGFPSNFGLHYPEGLAMVDGKIIVQNNPFFSPLTNPGAFYTLEEDGNSYELNSSLGAIQNVVLTLSGSSMTDLYASVSGSGIYTNASTSSILERNEWRSPLLVYPNPARSVIRIKSDMDFDFYRILDSSGRIVDQKNSPLAFIGVAQLPAGIYFLQVYSGNEIRVVKFLKVE